MVRLPLGSLRASLGYMSRFEDAYAMAAFVKDTFTDQSYDGGDDGGGDNGGSGGGGSGNGGNGVGGVLPRGENRWGGVQVATTGPGLGGVDGGAAGGAGGGWEGELGMDEERALEEALVHMEGC